jgi:hypothetical protein
MLDALMCFNLVSFQQYCEECLKRSYSASFLQSHLLGPLNASQSIAAAKSASQQIGQPLSSEWFCPSCSGLCHCASCQRRGLLGEIDCSPDCSAGGAQAVYSDHTELCNQNASKVRAQHLNDFAHCKQLYQQQQQNDHKPIAMQHHHAVEVTQDDCCMTESNNNNTRHQQQQHQQFQTI